MELGTVRVKLMVINCYADLFQLFSCWTDDTAYDPRQLRTDHRPEGSPQTRVSSSVLQTVLVSIQHDWGHYHASRACGDRSVN